MTANELADKLDYMAKYPNVRREPADPTAQKTAAAMLRAQHEAIRQLRECLIDCLDDSRQVLEESESAYRGYRTERLAAMRKTVADAEAALAATEGM